MRLLTSATLFGLATLATACVPAADEGAKVASAPVAATAPAPVATPAPAPIPAATLTPASADAAAGKALFNDWSCSACHTLAAAGASGSIGPSFDGNAKINPAYATTVITTGQGAMPAFGGQLSDAEITTLANYISRAKK
ncbi:MAG: hypothetical protein RLZZ08_442 [Pseudomonadota bacterium]